MKRLIAIFIFLSCSTLPLLAQPNLVKVTDSLLAEGTRLFRAEMSSWYATDYFLGIYTGSREDIGGYFSYPSKNNHYTCVFFSKGANGHVLGTTVFDSLLNNKKAEAKTRPFTTEEKELYTLWIATNAMLAKDTFFKKYKNTQFTIVPVKYNGIKKSYVFTSTDLAGIVIFGNDYELTFAKDNRLLSKKKIHNNLWTQYYAKDEDKKTFHTEHKHSRTDGAFISPTDIATLMLNREYSRWSTHTVISDDYVCLWECNRNRLSIKKKADWDKSRKK